MSEQPIYIAKTAVVKVPVGPATGHRIATIVRRGDVIPQGVAQDHLDSLETRGLIEKVEIPDTAEDSAGTTAKTDGAEEIPEGDPAESWTGKQLKAYAVKHEINLGKAKSKPDMIAAIAAAKQAPPAGSTEGDTGANPAGTDPAGSPE
ncbi:hypothetical protein MUN78_06980 [Leucobacter allii]|uniref:Rho termination factor N-terminal domain-containing protein n=1 Tax=Leucobacter allii TaxID=2932247 RepID=A0ABY4FQK1_9MICO|nr:hypothetical protein [Leucobacter allii]UOQ58560.1 hypothetical protein MUN78_06980 [Leucobacter allii]